MTPFDPKLIRDLPEARVPVLALAAIGVSQGAATVATAFAAAGLVVAVVESAPLAAAAGWLVGLLGLLALLAAASEVVAAWAGGRVAGGLRARLLREWLARDADSRPEPAEAVTLATQGAASVEPYVARFLPALVAAASVPVLALGALVLVDWPSALIVALTVPLLPVFAALIGRTTAEATERRWEALASLAGHFLDVMRGLPTLVSYGRATRQTERVRETSDRHRRATVATLRIAFLSSAALELLATISVALVAVTVGLRLAGGSLGLGTALVSILLAPEAYWPIRRVGAEFHAAADGAAALADIRSQLGPRGQGRPTPAGMPGGQLSVSRLGYRFPGSDRDALVDVTFTAGRGLTVVTGPSGAGKSTLLELLAGLRAPTEGHVRRGGGAHLVSQRPFLPSGTLADALRLGNDASDGSVWAALRDVGLDGQVAALPSGLWTPLGDEGFGLSAGQRARVALARCLLSDSPVLLLDEPTAHLDPTSAAAAHAAIRRLASHRTVVVVTHRAELVALADQHVRLGIPVCPAPAVPLAEVTA